MLRARKALCALVLQAAWASPAPVLPALQGLGREKFKKNFKKLKINVKICFFSLQFNVGSGPRLGALGC